ncbi:protein DpdE [Thalassotalea ponticola]|uniref:protein DpdE n=1 Tax=Thalassotalea ponticola TaxID=1523392 RepID=UPI0025B59341|nr:protein DpdE [Thalassotalea ponticola]MDN3652323.1 protein DpdE [Thalassotalea ponticola]
MNLSIGALVSSPSNFAGIGKIASFSGDGLTALVAFFIAPNKPLSNQIEIDIEHLELVTSLGERSEVFVKFPNTNTWKMGHYDGDRPGNQALISFSKDMRDVYDFTELFIPNAFPNTEFCPSNFLKGQGTSSPYLCNTLSKFYHNYYEQKRSCHGLSSLISSSVELEAHQLAVVQEILKSDNKKYLLCDEVGLGKTIEAGFVIRQHIIEKGRESKVLIIVPDTLIEQWEWELTKRFHLGSLLNTDPDNTTQIIHISSYAKAMMYDDIPSMVVLDEAHQISSFPFNAKITEQLLFNSISGLTSQSEVTLLLTGTPMTGHPSSYYALLHLLDQNRFPITESSISVFNQSLPLQNRFQEVSRLLKPENDDDLIDGALDDIEAFNLNDDFLQRLIVDLRPLVDLFSDNDDPNRRNELILEISNHFKQSYLYDFRMLRNSRATGFEESSSKDSDIELLFPGLNKAQFINWESPNGSSYLDEHFEQYRSELANNTDLFRPMSLEQFKAWSESLLTSPIFFSEKVRDYLSKSNLSDIETEHWMNIIEQAPLEQESKNNALEKALSEWLNNNPNGKAVIFCGEVATADDVFSFLLKKLKVGIKRHRVNETLAFNDDDDIRVLVCDEKGEDGLNLHGNKRLAIHYSMPILLSRIEQRNGRLNRYSATSKGVSGIDTFVLTPKQDTFYKKWALALQEGIGCFNYYRANIQDEIDSKLETDIWPNILENGYAALDDAINILKNTTREIYRSREIIAKLATVDLDKVNAKKILADMRHSDDVFDESKALSDWITEGILFSKQKIDDSSYRFRYIPGRTKMKSSTLIDRCIVGLDIESSSYNAPVTCELSLSRRLSVESGSYPLRYGQPFVDAIAEASKASPLGNSSAIIRQIPGKMQPKLFFIPQWLIEVDNTSQNLPTAINATNNTLIFAKVFNEVGQLETTPIINTLINAPYSRTKNKIFHEQQAILYSDTNITISGEEQLIDVWTLIEGQVDKRRFETAVDVVYDSSLKSAVNAFYEDSIDKNSPYKATLLTLKYILLFGGLS